MRMTWRRSAVRALVVGLALVAVTAGFSAPASAAEACTSRTTSTPFTQWNDANAYFLVTSGTFESGTNGWTGTSGVSTVSGNEPWKVAGAGAMSLRIPAADSASTPTMCVASDEDSTRFFYRSPGVSGSALHVSIYVTSGANVATNEVDLDGSTTGWQVSPRIMLPDIRDASGQQYVKITFSPRNAAATWQVDDVFIDPWKTR
jgi:hypothetical protein